MKYLGFEFQISVQYLYKVQKIATQSHKPIFINQYIPKETLFALMSSKAFSDVATKYFNLAAQTRVTLPISGGI